MNPIGTRQHRLGRRTRLVVAALATGLLAAGAATACEPAPQPGCTLAANGSLTRYSLGDRSYLALVPPGLTAKTAAGVPLVMSLHGLNSNATQMAGYTPWVAMAPTKGFVAVFPEGQDSTWRIAQGSPDVAFLRSVITDVSKRWCIAPRQIFLDGHSMGAYMAQRMACDAPDVVASVAEYAGGPPTLTNTPCTPKRAVAVAMFHGDADRIVPISYGQTSRDDWKARMHCNGTPATTTDALGTATTYHNCTAPGFLTWRTYAGQGHLWPTGAMGDDLRDRMWAWFTAHPLP